MTQEKYLTCIYCNSVLWKVVEANWTYQYCSNCVRNHDVDILYLWNVKEQSWSMIWLGFKNNNMLYRADISVFHKKSRLLSTTEIIAHNKNLVMYIGVQDHRRPIINPSKNKLDDFKVFDLNYYSFLSPENIKDKIKTLLLFQ